MPDIKQNPQPTQAYQIRLAIANAPGPFAVMEGLSTYGVKNLDCLPPREPDIEGVPPRLSHEVSFPLARASDTEYVATVYADQMLDEDSFGRGVCHWGLTNVNVRLKATNAENDSIFVANLSSETAIGEQAETTHYQKSSYPRDPNNPLESHLAVGMTDAVKARSNIKEDDLFAITIASKRMTP